MGVFTPINIMGMVVLIHAAYSAAHYKALVGEFNAKWEGPPTDVVVEVALGLVIIVFGSLWSAPKLRPVKGGYDSLNKTYESLNPSPEFQIFNHRGRVLKSRYPTLT